MFQEPDGFLRVKSSFDHLPTFLDQLQGEVKLLSVFEHHLWLLSGTLVSLLENTACTFPLIYQQLIFTRYVSAL